MRSQEIGALVLRLALGGLVLAHAWLKLFVFTPAGTAGYFASLGLPGALAYLTITVEVLAGVALVLGFRTRIAALALVPVLLGAVVMVHGAAGFWFNSKGGGWEFPVFWAVALVVQALIGDGAYALAWQSRRVATA